MIHLGNAEFIKIAFGCSAPLTVGVATLRLVAALMPSLETLALAGLLDALPGAEHRRACEQIEHRNDEPYPVSGVAHLIGLDRCDYVRVHGNDHRIRLQTSGFG